MKLIPELYEKNFEVAKFIFEKLTVRAVIEKGEDFDEDKVWKAAQKYLEEKHRMLNPQLYAERVVSVAKEKDFIDDCFPVIQIKEFPLTKAKVKPTLVELKKMEIAIKNKDEKTIKELETNYIFNVTENGQ